MIRDVFRFLGYNLRHYSLALWGFRLRFDPPYPWVLKFFPSLISEPVLEYRTYGAIALWAIFLVIWLPAWAFPPLLGFWLARSWHRSHYLQSGLVFWRQVLRENGVTHTRAHGRYIECLIREMERCMKAGLPWQELATEALRLQDAVIRQAASKDTAKRILAGF